jgi:hypothetical protein
MNFLNAIYATTGHPALGRYAIGAAFQQATGNSDSYRRRLHLLGDPEMQVWTNTSASFTVNVPTTIIAGASSINVTISNLNLPSGEKALICVQKGTEVYETKTITANGTYSIPLTATTAGSAGTIVRAPAVITTSVAQFLYKIDKDAPEILANASNPVQFQLRLNNLWTRTFNIDVFATDLKQRNKTIVSTTDGDEIIEPNETVTFNIDLQNMGKAPATGITAKLIPNMDTGRQTPLLLTLWSDPHSRES